MYVQTVEGLGQGRRARDCSGWEKYPRSFSKVIAQHYVSTELRQRLKAEQVRCRPDGKVCEVTFPGDITVGVSLVKVPDYVIARQAGEATPRREYDYYCTPERHVILKRRWSIVRIILIDPTGIFKNKKEFLEKFSSNLRDKFNNLNVDLLNKLNFMFKVEYRLGYLTRKDVARLGKLDFPVYFLARQHKEETILDLMKLHGIREDRFLKIGREEWKGPTRGVGIPSGTGYRKVGFIKADRVFDEAGGESLQAFVDLTKHEIAHMGNITSKQSDLDTDDDKYRFIGNLVRLRNMAK